MQSFFLCTHSTHPWFSLNPAILSFRIPPPPPTKKKTTVRGEGAGRRVWREEGAPRGEGENGSARSFCFPLIPQGCTNRRELSPNPPTDVRAHCLFQSWRKRLKRATSRASALHLLIPSSRRLLAAPLHLPRKTALTLRMWGARANNWAQIKVWIRNGCKGDLHNGSGLAGRATGGI